MSIRMTHVISRAPAQARLEREAPPRALRSFVLKGPAVDVLYTATLDKTGQIKMDGKVDKG